jgi:radical SAM superfamily enzyme YgiQ (UPF0313 family)
MRVDLVNVVSNHYIPLALHYLKLFALTDPRVADSATVEILEPSDVHDLTAITRSLVQRSPDVIGISCYVWNVLDAFRLCVQLKEELPETRLVLGGPELATRAARVLEEQPAIDVIVGGEGEATFRDLLSRWCENGRTPSGLEEIPGLTFRSRGETVTTPARKVIEDLDVIPSPYSTGSIDLSGEKRTILFESYRGCPFACSYCYYPKDFGKLIHAFSLQRVEQDLRLILTSGVRDLLLMDPTFNIPPRRAKRILEIIADTDHHPDLCVSTELRVDLLDDELIELLDRARIEVVEIGLESADPEVLRAAHRRQDLDRIVRNTARMKAQGTRIVSQLIIGLPADTKEKFKRSLDYSVELEADRIEAYPLQLLPGTPLYREARELGIEFDDIPPRIVARTRTMSPREIDDCQGLSRFVTALYNHGMARKTTRWLARFLGTPFSELIERYMQWRSARRLPDLGLGEISRAWMRNCLTYPRPGYATWQETNGLRLAEFAGELAPRESAEPARALTSDFLKYEYYQAGGESAAHPFVGRDEEGRLGLVRDATSIVPFSYSVPDVLRAPTGPLLPEPRTTWVFFRPVLSRRAVRSFFNGAFRESMQAHVVSEPAARRLLETSGRILSDQFLSVLLEARSG